MVVYFVTTNLNFGILFYSFGGYILEKFYGHWVYFVVVFVHNFPFCYVYREKSGNLALQLSFAPGLPDLFWYNIPKTATNIPKRGKIYQMAGKLTKWK
jgi:hypothetical protein